MSRANLSATLRIMTRTRRTLTAATLTALALVATGCTPTGGTASPTPSPSSAAPSPSVTASASPSPSPSASFDPHPDVADLYITTSGILPLTLGLPPATNPGAAMILFDPDFCYSEEMGLTTGDLGRWTPNYPDWPFRLDAADTEVFRIDILQPGITTPEGIGIGSTLAQLQTAYPSLTVGTGGIVSHVWYIQDANGTLVFETQNANMDGSLPALPGDEVILMRALSHAWGNEIDWGAANSGNVADACF